MNDDREEGEITEYDDISSEDEELVLRQRIAEIEAKSLELEKLAKKKSQTLLSVNGFEKENRRGTPRRYTRSWERRQKAIHPEPRRVLLDHKPKGDMYLKASRNVSPYRKKVERRKSKEEIRIDVQRSNKRPRKRKKSLKCQLIVSEDEFDKFDVEPSLLNETLTPDPLPSETEEDLELRLKALQSKQEIKNELKIILPPENRVPALDEEQELRLIALKSAVVKKHEARKRRKEESRPYSPTQSPTFENLDVPSPPVSVQNMDISPLTSPDVHTEDCQPVDMEICNEESKSPIFFTSNQTSVNEISHNGIPTAFSTPINGYKVPETPKMETEEEDDAEQLRILLLSKRKAKTTAIASPQKRKIVGNNIHILPKKVIPAVDKKPEIPIKVEPVIIPPSPVTPVVNVKHPELNIQEEVEDENELRKILLQKINTIKKPTSSIATKKAPKNIIQISNKGAVPKLNKPIVKKAPPIRSPLIVDLKSLKVKPVIINVQEFSESDTEFWESGSEAENHIKKVKNLHDDNQSPLSISMESPVCSPATNKEPDSVIGSNFEEKLSEFLMIARKKVEPPASEQKTNTSKANQILTNSKSVTPKKKLITPSAVRHLPLSTQIEYKRLVQRMQILERQKQLRAPLDGGNKSGAKKAMLPPTAVPKPSSAIPDETKKTSKAFPKEKLEALNEDEKKVLLNAQQRKVEEKRKNLRDCLDKFQTTIVDSKRAYRVQIKQELELADLRRLVQEKEKQLAEQRALCNETLHKRLQDENKMVVTARKNLTTISRQCLEIGKIFHGDSFRIFFNIAYNYIICPKILRLDAEGDEKADLGKKLERYRGEISSYKELKQKVIRGTFTEEDIKLEAPELEPVILPEVEADRTILLGENPVKEEEDKVPCLSYKSPLDHLTSLESFDPDGIICPFELMGHCQDDECAYKHLSSISIN